MTIRCVSGAVDISIEVASVINLSEGLRARCKFVYQIYPPAIVYVMDTSESGRVDDSSASEGVLDISLQLIMCLGPWSSEGATSRDDRSY